MPRAVQWFPSKTRWTVTGVHIPSTEKRPKRLKRAILEAARDFLRRNEGEYGRMNSTYTLHIETTCYIVNGYTSESFLPLRKVHMCLRSGTNGKWLCQFYLVAKEPGKEE